ncbi:dihydrolipoyl dehydrogenase family protein [Hymenobacter sp. BRD67]|uniref:dihydrolipoyl dehydrogenase family protein n=1 Tax=Hymenobacter sp. BRD67 TaxID=2675877 RepID=UPI0015639DB1|nr:FAD-dependent oxidoreductase [Hymenobacter sp. BRD67]QKG52495.1 FAD-dependent oxidoreductase [Hymenobacter sp. BRD67]
MADGTTDFDLIVLGAGSAGLGLALFMARVKLRVLLIDRTESDIGGDCLNHGCIPSKALIHAARQVQQARQATQFGLQVSGQVSMSQVMEYIRSRQAIIRPHENPEYLRELGIVVEIGHPTFVGEHEVEINGQVHRGRKLVIATGSRPQPLRVPGTELVRLYDNQHVWNLRELPARLLVVGGGPNGVELAQAMQRLGSQVTLVHHGPRLLEKEDPAISAVLDERLRAEGLTIHLDAVVAAFTTAAEAHIKPKNGAEFKLEFDLVYVAVGREVSFESLHLDRAGIAVDAQGHLQLDEYLQTTNPDIFAAGDAANSLKFSHGAELHVRLLLFNFFSP